MLYKRYYHGCINVKGRDHFKRFGHTGRQFARRPHQEDGYRIHTEGDRVRHPVQFNGKPDPQGVCDFSEGRPDARTGRKKQDDLFDYQRREGSPSRDDGHA